MLFLHVLHLGFQVINSFVPFGNFLTQFIIGLLQLLHFPATEKRTHSAYYDCSGIGGCTFELVRAYLRFHLTEFLFGKVYLLFLMPLYGFYALQFGFLLLNDEIVPFQMFFACYGFCAVLQGPARRADGEKGGCNRADPSPCIVQVWRMPDLHPFPAPKRIKIADSPIEVSNH